MQYKNIVLYCLSTSYVKPHFEVYKPACRCSLCKKESAMKPHRHDRTESFRWYFILAWRE